MQRRTVARLACIVLVVLSSARSPARLSAAPDEKPGELARKGFFGVQIRPATPDDRSRQNLKSPDALLVERVLPSSSAAEAGLQRGDILISLNGKEIAGPAQFIEAIAAHRAGDTLTMALVRDGEKKTQAIALRPRPLETSDAYRVIYGSVLSRGKRLRSIVTRPKDDKKHPALFLIQGIGAYSIENTPGSAGPYGRIIDDFTRRGFVTLRVDKPGQGDSEGGPTRDIDFGTELDGYRSALLALKAFPFVDPASVIIFGHSMGGVMGPLLGAEIPVKGIAVYGTLAKTWHEYLLENVRRQMVLGGASFGDIDTVLRQDAAIDLHIMDGLSPGEIAARYSELKERTDALYTDGKYYVGTHYAFFRQLGGKNLAAAWEKFGGETLVAWGKSDFVSSEQDHALIARIINRVHPGRGVFLALDGIDHGFHAAVSPEESFASARKPDRTFNPAFHNALRDWALRVCGAGDAAGPS
jgi:pimeloyl-ACP methyl ester carboxylesterase